MGASTAAWDLVEEAASRAGVAVGPLSDLSDAERVRQVVDRIWGDQLPPREIIRAMQHAGSVLFGAEADGELIGFVWGFLGMAEGLHLHSHMLGVLPEWQAQGVGYALKLAQRAACLDEGIDEIRWTYDPLVARNARFNLVKLGGEASRFLANFYGEMADRLNRADRSDRFEVRWRLASRRSERALVGDPVEPTATVSLVEPVGHPGLPEPAATAEEARPGCSVAVPADYHALKDARPELAERWREVTSERFRACFDRGLVATWFGQEHGYVFDRPGPP